LLEEALECVRAEAVSRMAESFICDRLRVPAVAAKSPSSENAIYRGVWVGSEK
jgi:hypothetical protein